MKQFLKKVHKGIYIAVVVFFFVLFFPFLYFLSRKKERYPILNHFRRAYAYISSTLVGFNYKYKVEKEIDWTRTYIFCANHTSNLDITVMTLIAKNNFAFLGKDELLDNPLLKMFFKTIDIPVDRSSRISSFKAFKRTAEYLKEGISVIIFPEGGIGDEYPPVLLPFKNGPFRLAIENKVPIIPISINDAWKLMWDDGSKYGSRPGICHICIHAPIETGDLTAEDADVLKDKVYDKIKSGLA
ncbi:lysophospholipid acyltransferase family protein [Desertivirga brevis]|uniref:lysophospholipid acyltransferase family protein n=1 Tax=Desertivirga brevis TaxID=2810310 RepID=UPI001A96C18D|nr:lysophospholipid acyltransferase family protein [Pedobacter sp. SYSU D00873]